MSPEQPNKSGANESKTFDIHGNTISHDTIEAVADSNNAPRPEMMTKSRNIQEKKSGWFKGLVIDAPTNVLKRVLTLNVVDAAQDRLKNAENTPGDQQSVEELLSVRQVFVAEHKNLWSQLTSEDFSTAERKQAAEKYAAAQLSLNETKQKLRERYSEYTPDQRKKIAKALWENRNKKDEVARSAGIASNMDLWREQANLAVYKAMSDTAILWVMGASLATGAGAVAGLGLGGKAIFDTIRAKTEFQKNNKTSESGLSALFLGVQAGIAETAKGIAGLSKKKTVGQSWADLGTYVLGGSIMAGLGVNLSDIGADKISEYFNNKGGPTSLGQTDSGATETSGTSNQRYGKFPGDLAGTSDDGYANAIPNPDATSNDGYTNAIPNPDASSNDGHGFMDTPQGTSNAGIGTAFENTPQGQQWSVDGANTESPYRLDNMRNPLDPTTLDTPMDSSLLAQVREYPVTITDGQAAGEIIGNFDTNMSQIEHLQAMEFDAYTVQPGGSLYKVLEEGLLGHSDYDFMDQSEKENFIMNAFAELQKPEYAGLLDNLGIDKCLDLQAGEVFTPEELNRLNLVISQMEIDVVTTSGSETMTLAERSTLLTQEQRVNILGHNGPLADYCFVGDLPHLDIELQPGGLPLSDSGIELQSGGLAHMDMSTDTSLMDDPNIVRIFDRFAEESRGDDRVTSSAPAPDTPTPNNPAPAPDKPAPETPNPGGFDGDSSANPDHNEPADDPSNQGGFESDSSANPDHNETSDQGGGGDKTSNTDNGGGESSANPDHNEPAGDPSNQGGF